jgi:hypothetical protein
VQERKQKLLSRNLESVFCLSISKSQGEVRKLDSARRYLDLEICPGSKIRGEARNLESGWPAPVLGNCSSTPKIRAAPALSLPVQCVRLPRCFRTETGTFLFSCVLETRNHGKWKLRSLYRYCMYARFPHAKGARNVARPPARATAWPERASLQRAPRAARHRVGARSHPRRTG